MRAKYISMLAIAALAFTACDDDDDDDDPTLTIPSQYTSANFDANVVAENTVINELSAMTSDVNDAESNAQSTTVDPITYPSTLQSVTNGAYSMLVQTWLEEIVKAANSPNAYQQPGNEGPASDQEGGKLGTRLLDENGLELEQMVQKGSFGAACYNHAVNVIEAGGLTAGDIDKLVEIHGAEVTFTDSLTTAAATYSRRRSDLVARTGFFYDIRDNLIAAKAAIEAGSAFNSTRDQALADYLANWEKSNYATVIYYCNATIDGITEGNSATGLSQDTIYGNALHAYAEGVGFTHGFRGVSNKMITDAEIDEILELLQAPAGQVPQSYRFLNEASLLQDLQAAIDKIQDIYGFTNEERDSFFINNNP
ncbi:MAG: hypothetical protein AAGC47_13265 [Bacteroidota bacterium]